MSLSLKSEYNILVTYFIYVYTHKCYTYNINKYNIVNKYNTC